MNHFAKLDTLLKAQASPLPDHTADSVYTYARCMAEIEHVVAVVSDLGLRTSRIFRGTFADTIGLGDYNSENSIWEKKILSLMPEHERDEKYFAELRFYNHVRRLGKSGKNYCLMSKLRLTGSNGRTVDVLHRMYYIYRGDTIRFAICLYGPLTVDFKGKSMAVNSATGHCEELTPSTDSAILSDRERQVLTLINSGMRSSEIATRLSISVHTVSRHRQTILQKLQVKNSVEACRVAMSMQLI